jgi:hypothetical protein
LTFALEKELSKTFLELAIMCKAVICCAYVCVLLLAHGLLFIRPSVSVTEGSGRQACEEEPEGYLTCHRRWSE